MDSSIHRWLVDGFSIVLIDLLLAGDNALVIAMAVRGLSPRQRRIGIALGAGAAVVLRIALTIVAAQLLNVEFIKLVGGAFVIWIAVRVLADASSAEPAVAVPKRLWKAVWLIVVADITMSTDNILAIAGASGGNDWLIIFGLALSIPFVVFSSNLLAKLMDRYWIIVYLGAGILGKVGGEMMLTDAFVERTLHPSKILLYSVEAAAVIVILVLGRILSQAAKKAKPLK
ncbi:MAG TPA: TerC family protein [Bryobacteraceae bacterium]|nr:TerC family protein [Bryobacteraceae bacterium]